MYNSPLATSLSYLERSSATPLVKSEAEAYELKPVRVAMNFNELLDIPIGHPFRYHYKLIATDRRSQQRQHIWMAKGSPRHNFLAEPLHEPQSAYQPKHRIRNIPL